MELHDGSTVAVIGGGPAGAFVSYFIKTFSRHLGITIQVDIYEPKDFSDQGAKGCNHCGGIVSESLIQFLATEGIRVPANVVMNAIDAYTLHTESGHVRLLTPLKEMRIAAIFRGGGPKRSKGQTNIPIESFDGYLLKLACQHGARHIQERVIKLGWDQSHPRVTTKSGISKTYDLLIGASGVNGTGVELYKSMNVTYQPPETSKTFINDIYLGTTLVERYVGNTMHVFLLNIPGINQGAIIPKGPFVTICFVAKEITNDLIDQFFAHPEIQNCLPPGWQRPKNRDACLCFPNTNTGNPINAYSDRFVMIGDCGVARLFKDGIGSAYRTAKACATTVVLRGVSKKDFQKYFQPACNQISIDNRIGHGVLAAFGLARKIGFIRYAILATASAEQNSEKNLRPMSMTLWDSFSGSAPYTEILFRAMLSPGMLLRFFWALIRGMFGARHTLPHV